MNTYFIEVTDTYGGEANYSWVNRFKVSAKTARGALRKVSNKTGLRFKKIADYGDSFTHDAKGACVRAFTHEWNEDCDVYLNVKVL